MVLIVDRIFESSAYPCECHRDMKLTGKADDVEDSKSIH